MTDFRETLYTVTKDGRRRWVYADLVAGRFYKFRRIFAYLLILFYLILPWIKIGSLQGVRIDLLNRKFIFFGETFWATDTVYLVMVLIALAISLFFFTSLLGRIWCGWACPETVFLEFVFRPIENLLEGSAAQRKRLDQQPWSWNKLLRKGTKYTIYILFSWIIANTALAYFVGAEPLLKMMSDYPWSNPLPFLAACLVTAAFIFQFGWFREQFCTVLCPYARFQSVLLDSNSLLVGYDRKRGEPRGKIAKEEGAAAKGDCIDCGLCVRLCPTGIDIRNGLQLECVQCAACADACDSIMNRVSRPTGLIRYATENQLAGAKTSILRPRVILYASILIGLAATFIFSLEHRQLAEFQIIRTADEAIFTLLPEDLVLNRFKVHISNKDQRNREFVFNVVNSEKVALVVPVTPFVVPAGQASTLPIFFKLKREAFQLGKFKIEVEVKDNLGFIGKQEIVLIGPE